MHFQHPPIKTRISSWALLSWISDYQPTKAIDTPQKDLPCSCAYSWNDSWCSKGAESAYDHLDVVYETWQSLDQNQTDLPRTKEVVSRRRRSHGTYQIVKIGGSSQTSTSWTLELRVSRTSPRSVGTRLSPLDTVPIWYTKMTLSALVGKYTRHLISYSLLKAKIILHVSHRLCSYEHIILSPTGHYLKQKKFYTWKSTLTGSVAPFWRNLWKMVEAIEILCDWVRSAKASLNRWQAV